jgi:hypothetical protein
VDMQRVVSEGVVVYGGGVRECIRWARLLGCYVECLQKLL